MSDLRRRMDEEARHARADHEAMDRVIRRAGRRRTTRRVSGAILALAIAGAGLGLAYATFQPGPKSGPAVGPTPAPTPTSDDATPPPITVKLENGSGSDGAGPFGLRLLDSEGAGAHHGGYSGVGKQVGGVENDPGGSTVTYSLDTVPLADPHPVTTIYCTEGQIDEASRLERLVFPGARVQRPTGGEDGPISVVLGEDFANHHAQGIEALTLMERFLAARFAGRDAERFLTPEALRRVEEDKETALYAYAEERPYRIGLTEVGPAALTRVGQPHRGIHFYVTWSTDRDTSHTERAVVGSDGEIVYLALSAVTEE